MLTLQRAAYVTEARAHADLNLPPLRQSFAEVAAELTDPEVLALGWRDLSGRLVAASHGGGHRRAGTPGRDGSSTWSTGGQCRTRGHRGAGHGSGGPMGAAPGNARIAGGAVGRSEAGHSRSGSPRGRRTARSY